MHLDAETPLNLWICKEIFWSFGIFYLSPGSHEGLFIMRPGRVAECDVELSSYFRWKVFSYLCIFFRAFSMWNLQQTNAVVTVVNMRVW